MIEATRFPCCVDGDEVGGFTGYYAACAMGEASHGGGICREQPQGLLDGSSGECDEVGERPVECEDAAGENASCHGAAFLDLHGESAEL